MGRVLSIALVLSGLVACNTGPGSLEREGSLFGPPDVPSAPNAPGGGADGLCTLPLPDGGCPDTPPPFPFPPS